MPETPETHPYTYWRADESGTYLRRWAGHCDVLENGVWVPVDVAKYGAPDPWATKFLSGEMTHVELSQVPVKGRPRADGGLATATGRPGPVPDGS